MCKIPIKGAFRHQMQVDSKSSMNILHGDTSSLFAIEKSPKPLQYVVELTTSRLVSSFAFGWSLVLILEDFASLGIATVLQISADFDDSL